MFCLFFGREDVEVHSAKLGLVHLHLHCALVEQHPCVATGVTHFQVFLTVLFGCLRLCQANRTHLRVAEDNRWYVFILQAGLLELGRAEESVP